MPPGVFAQQAHSMPGAPCCDVPKIRCSQQVEHRGIVRPDTPRNLLEVGGHGRCGVKEHREAGLESGPAGIAVRSEPVQASRICVDTASASAVGGPISIAGWPAVKFPNTPRGHSGPCTCRCARSRPAPSSARAPSVTASCSAAGRRLGRAVARRWHGLRPATRRGAQTESMARNRSASPARGRLLNMTYGEGRPSIKDWSRCSSSSVWTCRAPVVPCNR